jgi:hypothetical protein
VIRGLAVLYGDVKETTLLRVPRIARTISRWLPEGEGND